MPLVFGVIGIVLIISGVRGTVTGSNPNLVSLIKEDFTGQPNYFEWMAAIFLIGALGYIKDLAPISRALMALVIIGLLFSNKGFFAKLLSEVKATPGQASTGSTSGTSAAPDLGVVASVISSL